MSKVIGIDLGTTNSAAAYMTDQGPRLIPNAVGEVLTPSVVGLEEDGKLLVGQAAREYRVTTPGRCASLFKRLMGSDQVIQLPGRKFSAEELSSLVLRSLKADAEAFFGEPVERAVITVPAYFNDQQRRATINAGKIAGFTVERIFNEPTAAALAYGFHEQREDKLLLVVDLGRHVRCIGRRNLRRHASRPGPSGESLLGGEDFTRALAARRSSQGFRLSRTEMESLSWSLACAAVRGRQVPAVAPGQHQHAPAQSQGGTAGRRRRADGRSPAIRCLDAAYPGPHRASHSPRARGRQDSPR